MTSKRIGKTAAVLALGLATLALTASSFAAELAAVPAEWTPPVGDPIAMWGYIEVANAAGYICPGAPVAWTPGPTLTAAAGSDLTINIKNCLSEPVSMLIPGQIKATAPVTFDDDQGRTRVISLDAEVAPGADGSFTWNAVKAGSYLYYTASHPAVGVQMGLYGALKVDPAIAGCAYSNDGLTCDVSYDADQVLLYSEIDPALHVAVADGCYAFPGLSEDTTCDGVSKSKWITSTFDYYPRYFLINGETYPNTSPITVDTGSFVLVRFFNAGLKSHSPTLGGGLYMSLIAEDGNLYPFPLEQYGVELPPQKVIDAVLNIGADGTYALYDRALGLFNGAATGGGMVASIEAGAAALAPQAVADAYVVAEDAVGGLVEAAPGVLGNDLGSDGLAINLAVATSSLVSDALYGELVLNSDGSFTYTPNLNYNGDDQFTYVANDGGSNSIPATVSITVTAVNDAPTAVADAYDAVEGDTLSVAAPGVLANDSDIDGDPLTVTTTPIVAPTNGTLTLNADGSFDYTPSGAAPGSDTFTYEVCDPAPSCANAVVDINIIAFVNTPPVAVDDFVGTPQNTVTPINVIANDYDPDGTIDSTSVVLGCGLATCTTTAGGTVVNSGGGIVTFTPKNPGYRGTDTFTYTVEDDPDGIPGNHDGLTSNVATVRVNVIR